MIATGHFDLDGDDGVRATGDRVDVEGIEVGVGTGPERLADGLDGGVDRAGAGVGGRALLVADAEFDACGRHLAAAGGRQRQQFDEPVAFAALYVLGDGQQVGVGDALVPFAERLHAFDDGCEFLVGHVHTVFLQRGLDTGAAGVFTEDEPALTTDSFGRVWLVHCAVLQRAVGVDATLVCERVLADDGLVWREWHLGVVADGRRQLVDGWEIERLDVVAVRQRDSDLLDGDVAGALADAVDRAVDEIRASPQARVDVRHPEAEVVVGVDARRPEFGELVDDSGGVFGVGVADGVGVAVAVGASVVARLGEFDEELGVRTRAVLAE
jgi:hypothetical protein